MVDILGNRIEVGDKIVTVEPGSQYLIRDKVKKVGLKLVLTESGDPKHPSDILVINALVSREGRFLNKLKQLKK